MEILGEILGTMYCWFETFFGLDLANYMWGGALETTDGLAHFQSEGNMFVKIGMTMCIISLLVFALFYYIINHPKLNHWWGWLIFWIFNGIINLIVGWSWTLSHLNSGEMNIIETASGNEISPDDYINSTDCFCFGISNMILALLFMFVFSMLFKWWSSNCSKAPFVK